MTATIAIGLLIPLLGTMLGSAFVFFMKGNMPERVQKSLLGFASGVMVAASPDFVNGTPKSVGRWYQRGEQALLGSGEQGLRGRRAIG